MTLSTSTSQQTTPTRSTETSPSQEGAKSRGTVSTTTKTAKRSVLPRILIIGHLSPPNQGTLDPKSSKRVFELARDQQDELDRPDLDDDVIEDSFTRPRDHDLEEADEDDDEDEYQGFAGDEERELVRTPPWPDFDQILILWLSSANRRRRYPGP